MCLGLPDHILTILFSDVVNYRAVDHKESHRRIYEDSANSGGAWKPDAYQVGVKIINLHILSPYCYIILYEPESSK